MSKVVFAGGILCIMYKLQQQHQQQQLEQFNYLELQYKQQQQQLDILAGHAV